MPRRARLVLSGIPLHVTQRGNNRQDCFFQEQDRGFYLFHLCRYLQRSGCVLHAYCLMTNHVQLYTQYVNRTYGRTGTLPLRRRESRAGGAGSTPSGIPVVEEYVRLGISDEERQRAYRALFNVKLDPKRIDEIRAATNGNVALGSASFKARKIRVS